MAKRVCINRTSKKERATDKFLRYMFLINDRKRFKYKGDNSLWYALISYNHYKYSSLKQYIDQMKEYDRSIGNWKRINEIENIENLSEEEILDYGKEKYKEFWEQLDKEVDLEIQKIY